MDDWGNGKPGQVRVYGMDGEGHWVEPRSLVTGQTYSEMQAIGAECRKEWEAQWNASQPSRAPARFCCDGKCSQGRDCPAILVTDSPMTELDWRWVGGVALLMAIAWGGGIYLLGRIWRWWE